MIDGKLVTTDVRTGIFNLNEAQIELVNRYLGPELKRLGYSESV